jgi:hypothetical protein
MKALYKDDEFAAMKKLQEDFEESGQKSEFTVGTIQRRLLCSALKAAAIWVDLHKEEI